MRIAHVIHEYLPEATAGSTLHLRDLAQCQRRHGHEVRVFVRAGNTGREPYTLQNDEVDGLPVTRLAYDFHDVAQFLTLFRNARMDDAFHGWLVREGIELVHFHHLSCLASSMIGTAKGLGLPCVMTLHDYWMQCPRGTRFHPHDQEICTSLRRKRCVPCLEERWPYLLPGQEPPENMPFGERMFLRSPQWVTRWRLFEWERFQKRQLRLLDAWIAPSVFVRKRFSKWGLKFRRGAVVASGVRTTELRAAPRGPAEIRRIGFLGRVIPNKGVHVLLGAFQKLKEKGMGLEIYGEVPEDFGGEGYDSAFLERLSREGVALHGRFESENLPAVLKAIDCLVMPSIWWEPFGMVAREGAVAGLPVVVSDVAGLSDAVREGIALGFPPGDEDALTAVLQRLMEDPALREKMSRQGARVPGIEDAALAVLKVYERIGRGKSAVSDIVYCEAGS